MRKKVLIADDSAFMRMKVKEILRAAGYEIVAEAGTGEAALEKYKELHPDLVTMDLVMQGKGGINAVKAILRHDPNARVLMVSAMDQQALVVEAIQAGAKGFVVKPVDPTQLLAEAQRILGSQERYGT